MGGGRYDYDVATETRAQNTDAFARNAYITTSNEGAALRKVHPELDPSGKMRECNNETPIVVAMDVTRSRGDDTKLVYDKLPMFLGQLEFKGYAEGAGLSFVAVGDATSDQAPIQVSQFEVDNRLDEALSRVWIEEGGGGTGQESYELAAYFYARRVSMTCLDKGKKGFFFFLGDEAPYPQVSPDQVRRLMGEHVLTADGRPSTLEELHERRPKANVDQLRQILAPPPGTPIASKAIFDELQRRFHTFLIFPKKTMAERKADIDAEIMQRVKAAGGRYEGVDIRASLLWNNRNDLDLHVIPPSGEHIYFAHKQSKCGGWLDVDMNVHGETTKPVENVQWRYGTAPKGRYRVFVQNYRFHDPAAPTPYRVEVEINGRIQHFEGVISKKNETGASSDVTVLEFDYDPAARPPRKDGSEYDSYSDEVILKQWGELLPQAHILKINDPKGIVDVMLGVLAIVGGKTDLDGYLRDLQGRGQLALRKEEAAEALADLARAWSGARAEVTGALPPADDEPRRGTRARRL